MTNETEARKLAEKIVSEYESMPHWDRRDAQFRLARALLATPQPTQTDTERAKQLVIDQCCDSICVFIDGGSCGCFQNAMAAFAAVRAEGMEWRDIATAPKEFRPPLSLVNHHAPSILGLYGQAHYCVCQWGGPSAPYWVDDSNRKIAFQPTRWMPLPSPPSPETREKP